MITDHRRAARLPLAVALGLLLLGCQESKEPVVTEPAGARGPGQILYLTYCQSCHGVAGRGNGPAAASLRTKPIDLTQLWRRYGTPLDADRVADYIDGRSLLSAHGNREMPIWGEEFFEDAPADTPNLERIKGRLVEVLVEYLESLQSERQT